VPVLYPLTQDCIAADAKMFAHRLGLIETLPKKAIIAEVGCYTGDFSKELLYRCDPAELHLFDQLTIPSFPTFPQVIGHQGDSSTEMRKMPNEFFDWIYIDGDHAYEGVRKDVAAALFTLKPDGLLVFNDYIVYDWVARMQYGVVEVVNDLAVNYGWEIIAWAFSTGMFCDIALRRRRAA
jgi:hypothetical protein